ncbi:DNA cytosine methyltransferase [Mycobacterium sp. CSUR Q5927]|nr:DNA cytosine methyltransferase [Mycobacterium sp. CSUR Q5927]
MRIGSLFSGAGGLDLAVEAVFGGRTAWHSELDPAASKVLAHRWPGVPNLGDITAVDWSAVEPVDVMCGGWPCQPFSLAGKRKGADDERALWPDVARAVRMVRPRYVVLENVAAVLGPEFSRVADSLATLGYDVRWTCLRASDVGAPHRRERLFAYASRDGWYERRPESTGLLRGSDAAVGGDESVDLLPTPNASDGTGGDQQPDRREGHSRQLVDYALLHGTTQWGKYEPAIRRWESLTRPAPSPTEPNRNGKPRLSAAFAEWLMGWPAGWVTDPAIGISRNDQLRICGNGVVPQQAADALHWLLQLRRWPHDRPALDNDTPPIDYRTDYTHPWSSAP